MDTANFFSKCDNFQIDGQDFIIEHELISKERLVKNSNIIMFNVGIESGITTYGFWCPSHGGAINYNFKKSKENGMHLIDYRIMDF